MKNYYIVFEYSGSKNDKTGTGSIILREQPKIITVEVLKNWIEYIQTQLIKEYKWYNGDKYNVIILNWKEIK